MEKPSWAQAHRSVAERLIARRDDKEGLVDSLSWALEACCMQFPIVEAGEALDALDPFTFMAAWCRPMPEARKERLFLLVCEALELEVAETPSFYDCPEVEDYQARMFSHRDKTMGEEIERLWDLFAAAMGLSTGDAEDADGRDALVRAFIHAYDAVARSKIPARTHLATLLCWIDPVRFAPLETTPSTGTAYLEALARGATPALPQRRAPRIDPEQAEGLAREFLDRLGERPTRQAPASARAAADFGRHWDPATPDLPSMLGRCLEDGAPLLDECGARGAYRELGVFTSQEPEAFGGALGRLFSPDRPLEERIAPFTDACAVLFERQRSLICSAVARPSASATYRTAATLLFLHEPGHCHLFSPRKLQALDKRCAFGCRYRISKPESVSYYFDLADQVAGLLAQSGLGEELGRALGILGVPGLSSAGQHAVVVDELARFAVETGCDQGPFGRRR